MFKKIFFSLCLFCFVANVSAQTLYLKPHFGVKAGLSSAYSSLNPNFIYQLKFQSHPHLGAFYRLRGQKWVFQPEVQFSVKGGSLKGATATIRHNFNYAVISPTVGYIVTEGLTFEAGPEYGIALNSAGTKSNGPERNRDLGLAVGTRLDLLDLGEDFSINLRYVHGFSNLTNVKSQTLANRTFQVSVIYNFYKKK